MHVDISVQVIPVPVLEHLPGEEGGKSHQPVGLGTGVTETSSSSRPALGGAGHAGWGETLPRFRPSHPTWLATASS